MDKLERKILALCCSTTTWLAGRQEECTGSVGQKEHQQDSDDKEKSRFSEAKTPPEKRTISYDVHLSYRYVFEMVSNCRHAKRLRNAEFAPLQTSLSAKPVVTVPWRIHITMVSYGG